MTTKAGKRDIGKPFATIVLEADRYRDPESMIVNGPRLAKDLAMAGFYILDATPSQLVLAPPFVHSVSSDGACWTFQQWRPGKGPRR